MDPPRIGDRVRALLDVVDGAKTALVCTHDNPDPDSIASAWALAKLLHERRGIDVTLVHGGVLGRAENRAMVRLLKIPLVPIGRVDAAEFDVVGLVDTQPPMGNHSLRGAFVDDKKVFCVDHHPAREMPPFVAFADVGGDFGATSTKVTAYLHAAGVEFDRGLATALFYGIKSDTRDLGREVGDADVWAYGHLVGFTDMATVSAIEHPRLPRRYFSVLVRAFQRARCWDEVVGCDLGEVYIPDLVAECADRLLAAEGIRWSVVVGEYDGEIYASVRVSDRRYSAGKLVREVVDELGAGSAGGHGSMAGARVPHPPTTTSKAGRARARRGLLKKLIAAAGVDARGPGAAFAAGVDDEAGETARPKSAA